MAGKILAVVKCETYYVLTKDDRDGEMASIVAFFPESNKSLIISTARVEDLRSGTGPFKSFNPGVHKELVERIKAAKGRETEGSASGEK